MRHCFGCRRGSLRKIWLLIWSDRVRCGVKMAGLYLLMEHEKRRLWEPRPRIRSFTVRAADCRKSEYPCGAANAEIPIRGEDAAPTRNPLIHGSSDSFPIALSRHSVESGAGRRRFARMADKP